MQSKNHVLKLFLTPLLSTRKSFCVIFFLTLHFGETYSQTGKAFWLFGGGSASYFGEINPYNTPLRSLFGKNTRWHFSSGYEHPISPKIRLRAELNYIRIFGDDNLMEKVNSKQINYLRNLHFRNDIKELAVLGVYELNRTSPAYVRPPALSFYVLAGVAVLAHNPVAKAPREADGFKPAWVSLRPLETEQQRYPNMAVAIPLGIGIRYRLNKRWGVNFELNYRMTFTDYLDDISTNFVVDNREPMANRSLELTAAYSGKDRSGWLVDYLQNNGYPGIEEEDIPFFFGSGIPPFDTDTEIRERGNPQVKDSYVLGKFSLIFYIAPKIKCPKIK